MSIKSTPSNLLCPALPPLHTTAGSELFLASGLRFCYLWCFIISKRLSLSSFFKDLRVKHSKHAKVLLCIESRFQTVFLFSMRRKWKWEQRHAGSCNKCTCLVQPSADSVFRGCPLNRQQCSIQYVRALLKKSKSPMQSTGEVKMQSRCRPPVPRCTI